MGGGEHIFYVCIPHVLTLQQRSQDSMRCETGAMPAAANDSRALSPPETDVSRRRVSFLG